MKIKKKIARSFNFTFHYIDDVLSLNNSRFGDLLITPIRSHLLEIEKCTYQTDNKTHKKCRHFPYKGNLHLCYNILKENNKSLQSGSIDL
jgi:hypothetical protein